jgi:uncharacterized protein
MRMLRHIRVALLAVLATLAVAATASAQTFPPLSGRVVDQAGILDASTRAALTARLAALEARNSDQLVVATVASLQGQAIESYANGLFRAWRLGQKDRNNGVLLLVAPNERKVRIEVGYGLEGTLTDAVAKLIIEQSIVPRFRANDFAGGIVQATDDIVQVLTGDAAKWQQRAAAAAAPQGRLVVARSDGTELSGWGKALVLGLFFLMFVTVAGLFGYLFLVLLAALLVWIGLLPRQKDRQGAWLWLNSINRDPPPEPAHARHSGRSGRSSSSSSTSWSSSDSSSSSSDSFSGGGGSSGGGGASGSW